MKRLISLLAVMMVLFAMPNVFAEDAYQTTMDKYYYGSKELPKITEPYYKVTHGLDEIAADQNLALELLAQSWYNLLHYEVNTLGKKVKDTAAAQIYKGMKKKLCAAVITALDKDAIYLNVFFANSDKKWTYVYWLEWNLDDQTIRYRDDGVSDGHKKVQELFDDFMLSNWAAATLRDSDFGTNPDKILLKIGGSSKDVFKVFDKAYSDANDGKKNPIK